ncbi:MAG: sodium:solute symporter family protein [Nitrososphaerales archaeon]
MSKKLAIEAQINSGIVLGYMVLMIILGYFAGRRTKPTAEDFYLMERKIGPVLILFTYLATLQSMVAFLAATATYATHGVAFLVLPVSQGIILLLLTLLTGWKFRELAKEHGMLTQGDFIYYRYGSKAGQFITGLAGYIFNLFYIGTQPIGMAYILWALGLMDYNTALLLVGGVTLVYTLIGGLRAVVWTDFIQGILLLLFLVVAAFFILAPIGGIGGAISLAYSKNPALFSLPGPAKFYRDGIWVSLFIALPLGIWLSPHLFVRHYMARDRKSLAMIPIAVILSQCIMWVVVSPLLGLITGPLLGPVKDWRIPRADLAIPFLLEKFAPWWIIGPVLAGAMAAGMSTVDSQMLLSGQIFVRDIYEPLFKKRISDKGAIQLGRVCIIITTIIAIIIALNPPPLFIDLMIGVAFAGFAQFFPGLIIGLYWKRLNKYGVIVGLIAGLATVTGIQLYQMIYKVGAIGYFMDVHNGVWGLVVNIVLAVIVSLITKVEQK